LRRKFKQFGKLRQCKDHRPSSRIMTDLFNGFDSGFALIPVIVIAGFLLVFGMIIVNAIKGAMQWNKNNSTPMLTVSAKIVAKRLNVKNYSNHHANEMSSSYMSSSTPYYATFEVESGDRMQLVVPSTEYGMLAEGDAGELTF
jgi:hypothetical protein